MKKKRLSIFEAIYDDDKRANAAALNAFNTAHVALCEAQPPLQNDWADADEHYRVAQVTALFEMTGRVFERDSVLDDMLHAAYLAGWKDALRRVGALFGLPLDDRLHNAVEEASDDGPETRWPDDALVKLREAPAEDDH